MARLLTAASFAFILAACGGEQARAPGAVSEGEAKALEAAAAMIDQRRLPPKALPPEAANAQTAGDTAQPSGE